MYSVQAPGRPPDFHDSKLLKQVQFTVVCNEKVYYERKLYAYASMMSAGIRPLVPPAN